MSVVRSFLRARTKLKLAEMVIDMLGADSYLFEIEARTLLNSAAKYLLQYACHNHSIGYNFDDGVEELFAECRESIGEFVKYEELYSNVRMIDSWSDSRVSSDRKCIQEVYTILHDFMIYLREEE